MPCGFCRVWLPEIGGRQKQAAGGRLCGGHCPQDFCVED